MRPRYRTSTRSHRRRTTARLWLTNKQAQARLALECRQQLHDLHLAGYIQRADRLVAHQQLRREDHRAGDADALALAAAEFVRVALEQPGRQSDAREHRRHAGRARSAAFSVGSCTRSPSATISADPHARVEAAQGILEDDLQVAALGAQALARELVQVLAHPHDAPGDLRQQLQHRARERRLAAARLAHYRQRLPRVQRETDPGEGAPVARAAPKPLAAHRVADA